MKDVMASNLMLVSVRMTLKVMTKVRKRKERDNYERENTEENSG